MQLPDYTFYTEAYHGNQISEHDFPRLITRAGAYLKTVSCSAADGASYQMAACAVAEAWQINEQGGDLVSQTVDSWSKTFAQGNRPKSDRQRLLEAAKIYLGLCITETRWA